MDHKPTRWVPSWDVLLSYQPKILPPDQIKKNIRDNRLPATGRGSTRQITITPESLHFFFRESYVPEIAQNVFGIDDISTLVDNGSSSGLEQLIFDGQTHQKKYHRGALSLDSLDLDRGVYLTPDQAAEVLPNYDSDTFIAFAKEAGLQPETFKGGGSQHRYLFTHDAVRRLPRRDISEEEMAREVYTSERIPLIIDQIGQNTLDIKQGVWLLESQGAKLFENYTAKYFRKHALTLGIKHEKVFGKMRYFVTQDNLARFPRKQLSEGHIQNIRRLANIVRHQAVAGAFECTQDYVRQLAVGRSMEGRTMDRRVHSDERLEQAVYCYFDFPDGPTRAIIYSEIFSPLAKLMGKTSIKEVESFTTPFYLLDYKVNGVKASTKATIEEALQHSVTCYALEQLMIFSQQNRDLPVIVLTEEELQGRNQAWTLTNYFYLNAMKAIRQRTEGALQDVTFKYREGLTGLSTEEQWYLVERFCLDRQSDDIDWVQPTQKVMGSVMGLDDRKVSELELSILGKLRQPEFRQYTHNFGFQMYVHMRNMMEQMSLPDKPVSDIIVQSRTIST